MSLQIPVQKDIGEYDEKIVGKLTLRTFCCLALGFAAAIAMAAILHLALKADVSAMTFPIMACALPFWLAGFCKPYGMPFEKFVPLLAAHVMTSQTLGYRSCAAIEKEKRTPADKPRKRTRREKRAFKKKGRESYEPSKQSATQPQG